MDTIIIYPTAQGALGVLGTIDGARVHLGYFDSWAALLARPLLLESFEQSFRMFVIPAASRAIPDGVAWQEIPVHVHF